MGPLSLHTNNQSIVTTKLSLLENCLLLCRLFLPFIFYFLVVLVHVTCAYVMLQWKILPHLDDQQPYSHTLHYNLNCTPWTTHTYVPKHAHTNTNACTHTCACTRTHTHIHASQHHNFNGSPVEVGTSTLLLVTLLQLLSSLSDWAEFKSSPLSTSSNLRLGILKFKVRRWRLTATKGRGCDVVSWAGRLVVSVCSHPRGAWRLNLPLLQQNGVWSMKMLCYAPITKKQILSPTRLASVCCTWRESSNLQPCSINIVTAQYRSATTTNCF